LVTLKNYPDSHKFLYDGYYFDQQQKRLLRREELREELKKEFEDIFNDET